MTIKPIVCAAALLLTSSFAQADTALCDSGGAISGTFNINAPGDFICDYLQTSDGTPTDSTFSFNFTALTEDTGAIAATVELGFGAFESATIDWSDGETVSLTTTLIEIMPGVKLAIGFGGIAGTDFTVGTDQTLTLDIQGWEATSQQVWLRVSVTELDAVAGPAVVPLPAAAWLFGSALLGLVAVGRRRPAV